MKGHFFEAFPLHDVEKPVEIPFHVCMSKYKRILKIANSKGLFECYILPYLPNEYSKEWFQ